MDDYAAGGASSVTAKCLSNTPRVGLHRLRMDREEVIPQGALLLVTEPVGLQHFLPALRRTTARVPRTQAAGGCATHARALLSPRRRSSGPLTSPCYPSTGLFPLFAALAWRSPCRFGLSTLYPPSHV